MILPFISRHRQAVSGPHRSIPLEVLKPVDVRISAMPGNDVLIAVPIEVAGPVPQPPIIVSISGDRNPFPQLSLPPGVLCPPELLLQRDVSITSSLLGILDTGIGWLLCRS